jgi:hypothetical protein
MEFRVYNKKTQQEVVNYIASLTPEKIYRVKVTKKKNKRSLDQNALYWMWLTCIEQETGNEKEDLHDFFRIKYLGGEWREVFGEKCFKIVSTTKLNTDIFRQYLNKVQIFANTELGITLPNPEDRQFEHFKEYYGKFL